MSILAKPLADLTLPPGVSPESTMEIVPHPNSDTWIRVGTSCFRSWAGQRRVDGAPYTGPVYYLGTNEVARP